jgi:hypothetical protein
MVWLARQYVGGIIFYGWLLFVLSALICAIWWKWKWITAHPRAEIFNVGGGIALALVFFARFLAWFVPWLASKSTYRF